MLCSPPPATTLASSCAGSQGFCAPCYRRSSQRSRIHNRPKPGRTLLLHERPSKRATEERYLGASLEGNDKTPGTEKSALTDWAQVIQSNLTRLASLGIMFFLVAILVPQYRYNIRMAAFYDARADSMRLAGKLPSITRIEELEKTILAMTPDIDFGKAPSTPIDQLIALIKAAKG